MESTKFYSFYTLRGKIEAVQEFTLQDLHRDLLCVPGNCGCPQYWLFVPPRWQGEKWPVRWPAHTSALPGTLMSGLFLFWDARLVSTSSWGTVCLSPTKWTYMKKELMRWFLQRILKSGRPLLIHDSHNQDPYYFFTFGSGGVTFSTLWASSFCSLQIVCNSPTVSPISWLGFKFTCKYQFSSQIPARKAVSRYPAAVHPPHSHSGWKTGWLKDRWQHPGCPLSDSSCLKCFLPCISHH